MNKTYALLHVYDMLLCGKKFVTKDLVKEFDVSKRTAERYVNTIKAYINKVHKNQIVVYDREQNSFVLISRA